VTAPAIIGIIANPASGKDVRRLVARASVFDNQEKQAIVRRALSGIQAASGACSIVYLDDGHGIVRGALAELRPGLEARPVEATRTASVLDTVSAARSMQSLGCRVILTLGGDGTNRAVASAWRDAPLIPISTGTNNVFPVMIEATVAGAAAGLIASGQIRLEEAATRHKAISTQIDGEVDDLALIDAVHSGERFVGSRALLSPELLKSALLTRADPAAVGMTALGGLMMPIGDDADHGVLLTLGPGGETVCAPIAPGYYRQVPIASARRIELGQTIEMRGPGVLAFDGERERVLGQDQPALLTITRSGPWVIDVDKAMQIAAVRGCFRAPYAATAGGARAHPHTNVHER
jgi:predicted polyphosphate/ATP-dependent NAD kinase